MCSVERTAGQAPDCARALPAASCHVWCGREPSPPSQPHPAHTHPLPFASHHCPATSEALLGTDSGAIYELSVDEGRKERLQKLHELRGEAGPIAGLAQVRSGRGSWHAACCGVAGFGGLPNDLCCVHCGSSGLAGRSGSLLHIAQQVQSCFASCCTSPCHPALQVALSPERRLVLALAGTRLHVFAGGPTLEALFAPYADDGLAGLDSRFIDLPTQMGAAQLQLLCPAHQPDAASLDSSGWDMPRPEVFAVLSPAGIYYGRLDLNPELTDPADHLVKHQLLPAAVLGPRQQPGQQQQQHQQLEGSSERPLSLVRCGTYNLLWACCWPCLPSAVGVVQQGWLALPRVITECFCYPTVQAMTQYHFVLLYPSKLQYVNRIR